MTRIRNWVGCCRRLRAERARHAVTRASLIGAQRAYDELLDEVAVVRGERDNARRMVDALTLEALACDDRVASLRAQLASVLDVRVGFTDFQRITDEDEYGSWLRGEAGPG